MSTEIDDYLKEIDAEALCGEDLEDAPDFIALEQAIQGKPEQQIGESIQEAEPPNWKEVRSAAEQLLTRTRDLRILIYYLRSLSALEGFTGFAKGLELVKKLTELFWRDIHPQLDPDDDNDPTERVNILMSLCDFETVLLPLQHTPLVNSRAFGKFSLRDIHSAEGKAPVVDSEGRAPELSSINGAFQDCDAQQLKNTEQDLNRSLQFLQDLENFVTEQVGVGEAPSFTELRKLLKEIAGDFSEWLAKCGLNQKADDLPVEQDTEVIAGTVPFVKASGSTTGSAVYSNEEVVRTLNLICNDYKKHEPSSPIPILLERVIRLVGKDFIEIMKDMAPNGVEQIEFLRGTPPVPIISPESPASAIDNSDDRDYSY